MSSLGDDTPFSRDERATLDLVEGEFYVNEGEYMARHIIMLRGNDVYYTTYGHPDGELLEPGVCQRGTFRRWAKRIVAEVETENYDVEAMTTRMEEDNAQKRDVTVADGLSMATDEQLIREMRERGIQPWPSDDDRDRQRGERTAGGRLPPGDTHE